MHGAEYDGHLPVSLRSFLFVDTLILRDVNRTSFQQKYNHPDTERHYQSRESSQTQAGSFADNKYNGPRNAETHQWNQRPLQKREIGVCPGDSFVSLSVVLN